MSWATVPLGEICKFIGGGTPSRKRPDYFEGDIPWVSVKDFKTYRISDAQEHISEEAVAESATNLVEPGTILLVTRVGLGKVAIAERRLAINQDIKGLTPDRNVLPEFLFWFLLSQAKVIESMGAGATVKGVTLQDVKSIRMPIPSISEQRRIIDLLSRAEGIVRLRREALAKAQAIIPALFLDMFGDPAANPKGWPVVSLGEVLRSADYGSSTKASETGAGVPLIRMGNVTYAGDLDLSYLKYVELEPSEVARYGLEKGDILFNRTNSKELVGKTGIWDGSIPAVAASYFIRLRVDARQAIALYLWSFMNTAHMKRVIFETARGAIGQANINSKELKAFSMPLPPLDAQTRFEDSSNAVLSIVAQQAEALKRAETMFQALLARVFVSESMKTALADRSAVA